MRASDPAVARLRDKIDVTGDDSIAQDACELTLTLDDETTHTERVAHATGTLENAMSDTQLEEKFRALTRYVLVKSRVDQLFEMLGRLEIVDDVSELVDLCRTTKNEERT